MKNKFKSIAVAVVLGIVGIFAGLGLTGCGGSLSDLKSDYAAMVKKIESYSPKEDEVDKKNEVFIKGQLDGITTNLIVSYGTFADNKISAGTDANFLELKNKYNSILVISNDYITQNISVIQDYGQKNLSKSAKKAVKELCKDIKDFTKYLKTFANAKRDFADYFDQMESPSNSDIQSQLIIFKKSYGKLVSKNLEISKSVAKCMESTSIYKSLKNSTGAADGNTLKIIRDYARAKMLPIFNQFLLVETSNKFIWTNYNTRSDTLRKIDDLMNQAIGIYNGSYKSNLVSTSVPAGASNTTAADLFDMVDEFLKEANCYLDALKDLDIKDLAVGYEGNMNKYLKENKLAERYLDKMDQFLNITLPDFITNFSAAIR